jgi:Diacylglycerol acyltransferase
MTLNTDTTAISNGKSTAELPPPPPLYMNFCAFRRADMKRWSDPTPAVATSVPNNNHPTATSCTCLVPVTSQYPTQNDILALAPMTFIEHLAAVLFLTLGVPNGALTIPLTFVSLGWLVLGATVTQSLLALVVLLLPLALLPQPFVRDRLHCWVAVQVAKYFSFRMVFEEPAQTQTITDTNGTIAVVAGNRTSATNGNSKNGNAAVASNGHNHSKESPSSGCTAPVPPFPRGRPQILVAPPHGVFPYGNLLSMMAWPCYTQGHCFQGLAASAAVTVPIFKQILASIGVIDASRASARRALQHYPYTIGISTGGVAEVFETTADDECILLRERIGLIKLAIRTGADLVPCYVFGNTKLLSCWSGHGIPGARGVLEKISRRVGFALVLPYGRCGLPIPRRTPIFAVAGRAIATVHLQKEEPTDAEIHDIQEQLIAAMQGLFDRHKHLYGWQEKRLVIK